MSAPKFIRCECGRYRRKACRKQQHKETASYTCTMVVPVRNFGIVRIAPRSVDS